VTDCDKCGQPVPAKNDARRLELEVGASPFVLISAPRHLLPVVEGGRRICEGSPSRAQYLPGQPRDPRPQYRYDPSLETKIRAAYARMQAA
jgi:hypothetical protein